MSAGLIVAIVVAIVVLLGLYAVGVYNRGVVGRNQVREAYASIDVQLKKRYDLIPNIVEVVKKYAVHETETFEKVITLRNQAIEAKDGVDTMEANAKLANSLKGIFAIAESYPELKSSENYLNLQNQLAGIEEDISHARDYYNGSVKAFNNIIMVFPANIFAGIFGFRPEELFSVEDDSYRQAPKVEL